PDRPARAGEGDGQQDHHPPRLVHRRRPDQGRLRHRPRSGRQGQSGEIAGGGSLFSRGSWVKLRLFARKNVGANSSMPTSGPGITQPGTFKKSGRLSTQNNMTSRTVSTARPSLMRLATGSTPRTGSNRITVPHLNPNSRFFGGTAEI